MDPALAQNTALLSVALQTDLASLVPSEPTPLVPAAVQIASSPPLPLALSEAVVVSLLLREPAELEVGVVASAMVHP
jgi:hypothetical protein